VIGSSMSGQPLVEVDAVLRKLSSIARQFLSSQGIATTDAFLSTNTATMANALIYWRKQWESSEFSIVVALDCINRWKRKLRQLQPSMPEEPLIEQGAELQTLSPMAMKFLSSQGIATAEEFLSTKSAAITDALMDWRKRCDSSECSIKMARECIYGWKRKLRQLQSSMPEEPLIEQNAELQKLSPMARIFLSLQGIATAEAFLSTKSASMTDALMDWRKQWNSSECSIKMARECIYGWKIKLRQLLPSTPEEPLTEQDVQFREHTAGAKTMLGALSHRVSATPPALNGSPNDSRSSLLLQPEEPSRLGTKDTRTQGPGSPRQDGTNETPDAPDEMTLGASAATPVSQDSVHTKQAAGPPMSGTMHREVATRTFSWILPAAVNETAMGKSAKDDNASNDCSSHQHHRDFKGPEPRDDHNKREPDSKKRKRPQDESIPKKYRVF
jgi:uncharacterized protein (DUF2164 family)